MKLTSHRWSVTCVNASLGEGPGGHVRGSSAAIIGVQPLSVLRSAQLGAFFMPYGVAVAAVTEEHAFAVPTN